MLTPAASFTGSQVDCTRVPSQHNCHLSDTSKLPELQCAPVGCFLYPYVAVKASWSRRPTTPGRSHPLTFSVTCSSDCFHSLFSFSPFSLSSSLLFTSLPHGVDLSAMRRPRAHFTRSSACFSLVLYFVLVNNWSINTRLRSLLSPFIRSFPPPRLHSISLTATAFDD